MVARAGFIEPKPIPETGMTPPDLALETSSQREISVPAGVTEGMYRATIPLIRPSKLTSKERGGVGKELSEGWCVNFAVGCTHACPFCYVDAIHKRFGGRYGDLTQMRWGDYFLVPSNLDDAIERTPWKRWAGREVMMSSTHDPYLPNLALHARKILERALPAGVRFCIQTRSVLVRKDFNLLTEYPDQVRLQVSIATLSGDLSRRIEPRVPAPTRRLELLALAKKAGLRVGVIIAPVFPACVLRPDVQEDLRSIAAALAQIKPDHIYGESLHVRGENVRLVEEAIGEKLRLTNGFDRGLARLFREELARAGLSGVWWPES
jgi:DNA repair photolyase